jgi:hypothetical protein
VGENYFSPPEATLFSTGKPNFLTFSRLILRLEVSQIVSSSVHSFFYCHPGIYFWNKGYVWKRINSELAHSLLGQLDEDFGASASLILRPGSSYFVFFGSKLSIWFAGSVQFIATPPSMLNAMLTDGCWSWQVVAEGESSPRPPTLNRL